MGSKDMFFVYLGFCNATFMSNFINNVICRSFENHLIFLTNIFVMLFRVIAIFYDSLHSEIAQVSDQILRFLQKH